MNEYLSDVSYIGSSAPVSPTIFSLNFDASHVLIANDSNVNFRLSLTTALTTSSCVLLTTGQQYFFQGLPNGARKIGLLSTTSSTGGLALRLGAWD